MVNRKVNKKPDVKKETVVSSGLLVRVIVLMLVTTTLVWLVMWMRLPTSMPIRGVHFEGAFKHIQTEKLKAAVSGDVVGGFFSLDIDGIRTRLLGLAWVDRVSVRRVWPDVLKIRVVEQVPVAYWGDDALLNARAEIFHARPVRVIKSLPHFSGPDGMQKKILSQYHEANRLMSATGLKVVGITVNQRRAWQMKFSNGLKIRLGRRDVLKRLVRFSSVYTKVLAAKANEILVLDMRYTNGLAVHWKKRTPGPGAINKKREVRGAV